MQEKLKEFMKSEGFIFKNSTLENDEYYLDTDFKLLENNTCIRLRTINNKEVFPINKLPNLVKRLNVNFAILTVPREYAQESADFLAAAGIRYIWNFTPCILNVPKEVKVWNENLIGSFLQFTKKGIDEVN